MSLRSLSRSLLIPAVAAAGIMYAGFPARVGLTRSQAQISMPGDLVLPAATIQADRMLTLDEVADSYLSAIWAYLAELATSYETVFDSPVELVYQEMPDLTVWRTVAPSHDSRHETDLFSASLSIVVRPVGAGTTVHVRERYQVLGGRRGRLAATAATVASAFTTTAELRRIRRDLLSAA